MLEEVGILGEWGEGEMNEHTREEWRERSPGCGIKGTFCGCTFGGCAFFFSFFFTLMLTNYLAIPMTKTLYHLTTSFRPNTAMRTSCEE